MEAVSGLNELTSLDLNHNDISSIEPIVNLIKFKFLDLSFNQIKTIPSGILI
ncbi:leucine-rich repeat domain-containing protein [Listeria monocytogenes]